MIKEIHFIGGNRIRDKSILDLNGSSLAGVQEIIDYKLSLGFKVYTIDDKGNKKEYEG